MVKNSETPKGAWGLALDRGLIQIPIVSCYYSKAILVLMVIVFMIVSDVIDE